VAAARRPEPSRLHEIRPAGGPSLAIRPCRRLLVEPSPVRQAAEANEVRSTATLAPALSGLEADVMAQLAPVWRIERSQLRSDGVEGANLLHVYEFVIPFALPPRSDPHRNHSRRLRRACRLSSSWPSGASKEPRGRLFHMARPEGLKAPDGRPDAIRRSTSSARFSSKGGQRKIENALHKCRASPASDRRPESRMWHQGAFPVPISVSNQCVGDSRC
jgi:hypothetical protein